MDAAASGDITTVLAARPRVGRGRGPASKAKLKLSPTQEETLLTAYDEFKHRYDVWRSIETKYFPAYPARVLWRAWREAFHRRRRTTAPWSAAEDAVIEQAYASHGSYLPVYASRLFTNRNRGDVLRREYELSLACGRTTWSAAEDGWLCAMPLLYGGRASGYDLWPFAVEARGMGMPSALFPGRELWHVNFRKSDMTIAKGDAPCDGGAVAAGAGEWSNALDDISKESMPPIMSTSSRPRTIKGRGKIKMSAT
jgi:hypothetical protein